MTLLSFARHLFSDCMARYSCSNLFLPSHATWELVLDVVRSEFPDLNFRQALQSALRPSVVLLFVVVMDRERGCHGVGVDWRTRMAVSLGAALFTRVLLYLISEDANAVSRVIQDIVFGIGLLRAGAMPKYSDHSHNRGLTTAAIIWVKAALGVVIGLGREVTDMICTGRASVIVV